MIPRSRQYVDFSHVDNCFCPLLALQEQQQRAIFSSVIIVASLMMCSQLAQVFFEMLAGVNFSLQYTHCLSLARTSFSSQFGIFQLLAIRLPCAIVHNLYRSIPAALVWSLCSIFVVVPYTKDNDRVGLVGVANYVFAEDGVTNGFWIGRQFNCAAHGWE